MSLIYHYKSGGRAGGRSGGGGGAPGFLSRFVLTALSVLLASWLVEGIHYGEAWLTLALVALVLSLLNVFLKPLLVLFSLPFVVLTLGLGVWLINAFLLWLTNVLVDDFVVEGLGAALLGSLVISLVSFLANLFIGKKRLRVSRTQVLGSRNEFDSRVSSSDKDNVIDI